MSASDLFRAYAQRPVKHKVFISYHHLEDQAYYDAFSKAFHGTYEVIYDNSLDRIVDSDNTDYVIQRIRDSFISGSSCTIVLVGRDTWGRKYVDWEIKATLDKEHGLIGVRLPSAPVNTRSGALQSRLVCTTMFNPVSHSGLLGSKSLRTRLSLISTLRRRSRGTFD